MCCFSCKGQKNYISLSFKLTCNFLVKSKMVAKMAAIIGDATGIQQQHHP